MMRRLTDINPDLRDRWTFDDDAPVAPEAPTDEAPKPREEILAQPPADLAPRKRDFLFTPPAVDAAAPAGPSALHYNQPIVGKTAEAPVAPLPPPQQAAAFASASSLPSPWAKIQVSDKARARAAAAGLHRYVEESSTKPRRLLWVSLSAILLLFVGAVVGLEQFAEPPATRVTQSAETPFPDVSAERPSYIEVPPAMPRAETPARDLPLIEVAP